MEKLKIEFNKLDMKFESTINDLTMHYKGLFQMPLPPFWLFLTLMNAATDIDEIWMGYVLRDDAISYLNELQDLFGAIKPFLHNNNIELKFPLSKISKKEIGDELPNVLFKEIVYCEYPSLKDGEYKPCGDCESCGKHQYYFDKNNDIQNEMNYNIVNEQVKKENV